MCVQDNYVCLSQPFVIHLKKQPHKPQQPQQQQQPQEQQHAVNTRTLKHCNKLKLMNSTYVLTKSFCPVNSTIKYLTGHNICIENENTKVFVDHISTSSCWLYNTKLPSSCKDNLKQLLLDKRLLPAVKNWFFSPISMSSEKININIFLMEYVTIKAFAKANQLHRIRNWINLYKFLKLTLKQILNLYVIFNFLEINS